jgi:DNA-binding transcriptional ArsR family regulator
MNFETEIDLAEVTAVLKALSDPNRLRILPN